MPTFQRGRQKSGTSDERHLWPSFFWLISQCKPDTVIGEQVASKDALAWWDIVHNDMEGEGYACGVSDTCAAGFGAPHIRQRLYWVAHSNSERIIGEHRVNPVQGNTSWANCTEKVGYDSHIVGVDNAEQSGLERHARDGGAGREKNKARPVAKTEQSCGSMPTNGFWANPDWLWCRDKKWRPVKSGLSPLVDGLPKELVRSGDFRAIRQRLKGYGNAIVIPQAVEFIKAVMEIL